MTDDTTPTPRAAYQHGRADERDGYSGEHSLSARVEPGEGEEGATHATGSDAVGLSSPRLCPCGANVWGGKCVASGMTSAICGHVPLLPCSHDGDELQSELDTLQVKFTERARIRCEHCTGRGTTFVWAKIKCSTGYGTDMVTRNVQIPVKCEPCSGNGFMEGFVR